jgi:hypothetical protein
VDDQQGNDSTSGNNIDVLTLLDSLDGLVDTWPVELQFKCGDISSQLSDILFYHTVWENIQLINAPQLP